MFREKKNKGIPLDSCPVIRITGCVPALVGPDTRVSSHQPPLLEPEKRFALDLCWSSSSIKSNIIHSTRFFRTIAPDICNADQTHFESKLQKSVKIAHPHVVCSIFVLFLSISVQIGGALKLLFPPVIVFFFLFWTNQAALKRETGMYEGWKPFPMSQMITGLHVTRRHPKINTKRQPPAVYSPYAPFPLKGTHL